MDIGEEESFFEEYFWYFIISSGILVAITILLEIFTNLVLLSQILALVSVFLSSYGVVKEAIEDVRNKRITANLLMLIAAVASFIILHGQEGALAILLYAIAERIEELTTEKSKTAIKELLELAPDEALLKTEQGFETVPSKEIKKGSIIGIKPAMKVPLDGVVIKGESYFDESPITGEALPIFKTQGDEIYAASINSDSFIELEVIREQGDSVVAQIAENVRVAFQNKSKSEKFIQKFARYYTPIILISAILVMIIPSLFFGQDFNEWFYRGLVLLVVSCPCALTLSTPLANIAALTKLAREGIYVKGNQYLEAITGVKVIAFDKTGTLTEGKLKVIEIKSYDGNVTEILKAAASLELLSEHPIGEAIVNHANNMGMKLTSVDSFEIFKGKGIRGKIQDETYYVGSQKFLKEQGYDVTNIDLKNIVNMGAIPIFVGKKGNVIGIIIIRDVLRITAPLTIENLNQRNINSVLISGDNKQVCDIIGECLNIEEIQGELLPAEKLQEIEHLKEKYKGVAMVGDGINDAPALARSDVGIAIGASATDLTLETSDVVIMSDDLNKLITFLDISKKANRIIKQNIWISIIVKVSFAVLTVLGFMNLWLAVGIGDMGVSLLVLFNSLRILRYRNKLKDLSSNVLEQKARMLVCETCEIKQIIPQHHGRDMIEGEETLVCWRKILNGDDLDECQEEVPLLCPKCNNKFELV